MKVLLYKGVSFTSKLIRWYTKSEYSHAAILLSDGTMIEAWSDPIEGPKDLIKHLPWSLFGQKRGGVKLRSSLSEGHTPGTPVDIFGAYKEPSELKVYDYCMNSDYEFDFFGLIGFVLPFVKQDPNKVYCSELVVNAFRYGGVDLLPSIKKPTPGDLAKSPYLRYEESVLT